jgi:hypothetical protein
MSEHEQQQIADLTERLLATREQREDWAKFALDMQRERDAARQEVRTLTAERDRLAAGVERVRNLPTWDHDPTGDTLMYATMGKMDEAGYTLTEEYAGDWVRTADILAALGGTND